MLDAVHPHPVQVAVGKPGPGREVRAVIHEEALDPAFVLEEGTVDGGIQPFTARVPDRNHDADQRRGIRGQTDPFFLIITGTVRSMILRSSTAERRRMYSRSRVTFFLTSFTHRS
jgi:hypothetical protein